MQSADTIPACFATEREYDRNLPPVWYHTRSVISCGAAPGYPPGSPRSSPAAPAHADHPPFGAGRTYARKPARGRANDHAPRPGGHLRVKAPPQAGLVTTRLKRAPRVRVRPDSIKLSTIHSTRNVLVASLGYGVTGSQSQGRRERRGHRGARNMRVRRFANHLPTRADVHRRRGQEASCRARGVVLLVQRV